MLMIVMEKKPLNYFLFQAKGPQTPPRKPNDSENVSIEETTTSAASLPSNAFANEIQQPSNTFPDQVHYGSSHAGGNSEEAHIQDRSIETEQLSKPVEDGLMESLNKKQKDDLEPTEDELMATLHQENTFKEQSENLSNPTEDDLLEKLRQEDVLKQQTDKLNMPAEDELMEKLNKLKQETDLKEQTLDFLKAETTEFEIIHNEDMLIGGDDEPRLDRHSNTPNLQTEDLQLEDLHINEKQEIVDDLELMQRTRALEDEYLSHASAKVLTPPTISVMKAPEEEVPKILEIRVLKVQIVESNPRSSMKTKLPEGVSTFYDFNASVSREPTPEPTLDIKTFSIQEGSVSRESSVGRDFSREPSAEPFAAYLNVAGSSDFPKRPSTSLQSPEPNKSFSNPPSPSPPKTLAVEIKPETYQRRLLEDISPFYDFNASVNPWFFKRQSISENKPTKEDLEDGLKFRGQKQRRISIRAIRKQINKLERGLDEGISDFFDFSVSMSKSNSTSPEYSSTSRSNSKDRELPSIFLPNSADMKYDGPKCNTAGTRHLTMSTVDNEFRKADPFRQKSPSPKCFSADNTFLSMEILDRNFKRSTYINESLEFADHMDYRREFTKTFRRSESKSPSPVNKVASNTRMLDEEFKGSLNFPYDYDRRASDTALLQKNEILFQIQEFDTINEGFERDEDYLNALEEDEYHHFRRFSLNQDFREASYDNDYFIQEIEVRTLSGEKVSTWVNSSPFECSPLENTSSTQDSSFDKSGDISTSITSMSEDECKIQKSDEELELYAIDDLLQNLDENEYTGSEDERQTVYEVGDYISQSLNQSEAGKQLIEDTAVALEEEIDEIEASNEEVIEGKHGEDNSEARIKHLEDTKENDIEAKNQLIVENLLIEDTSSSTVEEDFDEIEARKQFIAYNEGMTCEKDGYQAENKLIKEKNESNVSSEESKSYDQSEEKNEIIIDKTAEIWRPIIEDFITSEKSHTELTFHSSAMIEIEEIYVDAIKDRKQSGILREYDSLVDDNAVDQINIEEPLIPLNAINDLLQNFDENDYTGSEDERLTVVEVDDGIVSDDRNDESYTEQSHSECEQADREVEHQWIEAAAIALQPVAPRNQQSPVLNDDDSVKIDEIYVDAIRNRKQSGILRDYDSLALDSSDIYSGNEDLLQEILGQEYKTAFNRSSSVTSEGSYYGSSERKDRYLGDANADARTSVRQRARYGVTQKFENLEEDIEVDMSYVPKKEYNWRKNFKLDEDDEKKVIADSIPIQDPIDEIRSPSVLSEGGVKKKKPKKKLRKSSKSSLDDDNNLSFSPQNLEDDDDFNLGEHYKSPSVESRRSKSRFSLEELESRRSSIHLGEEVSNNFEEEVIEMEVKQKKVKKVKRKKSKGDIKEETLGSIEQSYLNGEISYETLVELGGQDIVQERTGSKSKTGTIKKRRKSKGNFTPLVEEGVKLESSDIFERDVQKDSENVEIEMNVNLEENDFQKPENEPEKKESTNSSKTDSFDFVKDSGFYPLF